MELSQKKCQACEGGVPAMSKEQAEELLKQVPTWKIIDWKVTKEFKFKNFLESLNFVNKVGKVAEAEQHHPDLEFGWGYCRITLFTHALNGLSENDFILAAKIDHI